MFGVGLAISYLFVQETALLDGNFVWCGQIACFVLFAVSTVFLLRQGRGDWRLWVCLAVLALHLVCGLVWYHNELTQTLVLSW